MAMRNRDQHRRSMSFADRLRQVDALFANARVARPGWPTAADREADLAHHQALIAKLDRVRAALAKRPT